MKEFQANNLMTTALESIKELADTSFPKDDPESQKRVLMRISYLALTVLRKRDILLLGKEAH